MLTLNVGGPAREDWTDDGPYVTQYDGGVTQHDDVRIHMPSESDIPPWVFRSSRNGACQWSIPTPESETGWYDVCLWWCALDAEDSDPDDPWKHVMGVAVDGAMQEDALDVVLLAGGMNTPVGVSVPLRSAAENIIIDIYPGPGGAVPYLNAITVEQGEDPLKQLDYDSELSDIIESVNYLLSLERTRREEKA